MRDAFCRRYTNLDEGTAPAGDDIGSYLARLAFYEAASVDAFTLLARELGAHGAPDVLVRSCKTARRDESRHVRMATKLARRHGAVIVTPPALLDAPARALEEIAIENAVEGCVREAFSVTIATWQAEHAPTTGLRAFFASLAEDEARHATLSAGIDAWLRSRLSVTAARRVDVARNRGIAALQASLASEPIAGLGLPSASQAHALFATWLATHHPLAA
jgi:hypothetical protein